MVSIDFQLKKNIFKVGLKNTRIKKVKMKILEKKKKKSINNKNNNGNQSKRNNTSNKIKD